MAQGRLLLVVLFVAVSSSAPTSAQVVINEFAYDDSGADDEEYVELYNATGEEVDLTGWRVVRGTGATASLLTLLPRETLSSGAFLLVGSANVPGVDVIVPGGDLLGDGPSYLFVVNGDGEPVDAVAYEANKGFAGAPEAAIAEEGIWGNHVLVSGTHLSWQRWEDGQDTDVNAADFGHLPWTPGRTNNRDGQPTLDEDFEAHEVEAALTALPGSFVPATVVDPALASVSNPNVIDESPDGGLAAVVWDPAGGGNFAVLEARAVAQLEFEAWVYFDAAPRPGGELETWSVGLAGTSGTFFNTPILFDANGNTGVTWTYQITDAGGVLSLIDEGLGGPAASRVRLAEIPILVGENDGWQRLRLSVDGTDVQAAFGGAIGGDDGEQIRASLRRAGFGSVYIGYREALSDNTAVRPFTFDAVTIRTTSGGARRFVRGDTNADRDTNLADAVFLLNHLFVAGAEPPCVKAADVNDDGGVNLSDAVFLLAHLFSAGASPPAPTEACGLDASADALSCVAFSPCG